MACNLNHRDNLDDYPPLIFTGFTASELDKFLDFMERGISLPETPDIVQHDLVSLHGDAVLVYADMVGPEKV